jgi:hypothetical protein
MESSVSKEQSDAIVAKRRDASKTSISFSTFVSVCGGKSVWCCETAGLDVMILIIIYKAKNDVLCSNAISFCKNLIITLVFVIAGSA